MAHRYFPHTSQDVETMLNECGVKHFSQLYADIPSQLLLQKEYDLPDEMSEYEIRKFFRKRLEKNIEFKTSLAGGGYYSHAVPAVIPSLISRSEFLTAYTPYQPEISQGTLQYIFEYQSLIARLTGLEISNASLYDGATATAEAVLLAVANARKKNRVLISQAVNPNVINVVKTYCKYRDIDVDIISLTDKGTTSKEQLIKKIGNNDVAAVVVASPNYYGILEDFDGWSEICSQNKSLFIMNCVAADLVSIKSPAEWGADIAVGDAQSLGIPLSFGGPYLGYIATSKKLMRKLPGRIVGMTDDAEGNRAFVLTLQAREQHIRREKATSNICSNQGLMALFVTIYMSLLGEKGIKEINEIGANGAHWLAQEIVNSGKASLTYPDSNFFNEFMVTFYSKESLDSFLKKAIEKKILPGIRISDVQLLIAVTETADFDSLKEMLNILKNI